MAVLNPLQAFFNTLVYRKWTNKLNCCITVKNYIVNKLRGNVINATPSPNETSPLLHNETDPQLFPRRVSNRPDDENENFHRYSIQCPCV